MDQSEYPRFLLAPKVLKQLLLEVENAEKRIKQGEKDGSIPKSELTMMWMDTVTKKEALKASTGLTYEQPLEVSRMEKTILMKLFRDMSGFSWSRNFGWIGQGLAKGRLAIDVFEVPASLYDGIETRKVMETRDNVANVYKLDFSGELYSVLGSILDECLHFTFVCNHCSRYWLHWEATGYNKRTGRVHLLKHELESHLWATAYQIRKHEQPD